METRTMEDMMQMNDVTNIGCRAVIEVTISIMKLTEFNSNPPPTSNGQIIFVIDSDNGNHSIHVDWESERHCISSGPNALRYLGKVTENPLDKLPGQKIKEDIIPQHSITPVVNGVVAYGAKEFQYRESKKEGETYAWKEIGDENNEVIWNEGTGD